MKGMRSASIKTIDSKRQLTPNGSVQVEEEQQRSMDENVHGQSISISTNSSNMIETVIDRERLLNDFANTGVISALMGGFALSSMLIDLSKYGPENQTLLFLGNVFWFISFCAAHICTLAAAASALLYRKVNKLTDDSVHPWLVCFGVGTKMYEVSIVLFGILNYHGQDVWQIASAVIGLSCCMAFLAVFYLAR